MTDIQALAEAVSALESLLSGVDVAREDLQARGHDVLAAAPYAQPEEIDESLRRLAPLMTKMDLLGAGMIALICGALVEDFGGNPAIAVETILSRISLALSGALAFEQACLAAAEAEGPGREDAAAEDEDERSPTERFAEALAPAMLDEARAWAAMDLLGPAAVAMLSASPDIRAAAHQDIALVEGTRELGRFHQWTRFLANMLQVLDGEEIIVLHPELLRGYRVRLEGIADNFQLNTLLADALIGDPQAGWLPGEPPDPRVVAAARDAEVAPGTPDAVASFNLVTWRGLDADGSVLQTSAAQQYAIGNDATPADIEQFEGVRIVLLDKSPFVRAWQAGRRFMGMPGRVEVVEVIPSERVQEWMVRLAAARSLN